MSQDDSLNTVPDSPLAVVPDAMGDSYFSGGQIFATSLIRTPSENYQVFMDSDIPGSRRSKITENNCVLPRNRVYFNYQSFQNVGTVTSDVTSPTMYDFGTERYTLGLERTFGQGLGSIELRLPFRQSFSTGDGIFSIENTNTRLDNTTIALKLLLSSSRTHALATGLAVGLPTACDVSGNIHYVTDEHMLNESFTLTNDTVFLGPFIGAAYCLRHDWFFQGFMQVDVAANGDQLTLQSWPNTHTARFNAQTLMYLDATVGRWFFRTHQRNFLTGLAAMAELHYTTTLQDADTASVEQYYTLVQATNTDNRVDMLNLTMGFHMEFFRRLNVRVGGVVPVRSEEGNRAFDSEIVAQANLVW